MRDLVLLFFCLITAACASAQEVIHYKQVDTTNLYLEVYPAKPSSTGVSPAMVFFHGGGWAGGDRSQFEHHAYYFSKRGISCFLVDYRLGVKHGTSPYESLKDANSAIRFIRKNAERFSIDPHQIIAAGGSAGGHLAAATALTEGYNEESDNLETSGIPNCLILFNPVIDNGPGGFGYQHFGGDYKNFSPLHNIQKDAPPTLILIGTDDELVPVETVKYYQKVMEKVGSRCDLMLYKGQKHAFFNYDNFEYYKKTVEEADTFLQSMGYLKEGPQVKIE